jgi:hypothetical protein
MTEHSEKFESKFTTLPSDAIVYRALIKKRWVNEDTGEILPDAFFLRKDKCETGVSVNIAAVCSPEDCAARFKCCKFVASLQVETVRNLGLDVVQDKPNHANINGLPYWEDDLAEAVRLASLLANQSKIIRII